MHQNIHHKPKPTIIKREQPSTSTQSLSNTNQMGDNGEITTPRVNIANAKTKDGWKCHLCNKVLKKPLHLQ